MATAIELAGPAGGRTVIDRQTITYINAINANQSGLYVEFDNFVDGLYLARPALAKSTDATVLWLVAVGRRGQTLPLAGVSPAMGYEITASQNGYDCSELPLINITSKDDAIFVMQASGATNNYNFFMTRIGPAILPDGQRDFGRCCACGCKGGLL